MAMGKEFKLAVSKAANAFLRALSSSADAETMAAAGRAMQRAIRIRSGREEDFSREGIEATTCAIMAVVRDRFADKVYERPNLSPQAKEMMASEFGQMLDRVLNEVAEDILPAH